MGSGRACGTQSEGARSKERGWRGAGREARGTVMGGGITGDAQGRAWGRPRVGAPGGARGRGAWEWGVKMRSRFYSYGRFFRFFSLWV